ncbi:CHAD domain-containing protein [Xanthobacter autotrophicus DSM 431]|uniref:CHAD domain-containing protein n=1 Tax=Xanthobacter nonsaccharivorans TaxID=3119912 RepID=UPI00372669BA
MHDALSASLATLEAAASEPDAVEMVHDARKAMKEFRALLRLVCGPAAGALRHRTAEVARGLSGSRDRAAACEAIDFLDEEGLLLACDHTDALAALGRDGPAPAEAEVHRAALRAFATEAREAIAGAVGQDVMAADVAHALARHYRRARQAAFDGPLAMHEARKRVVTHRYQMSFVARAFSGRGGRRARRAQALRDLLGAFQDIETLRPMLRKAEPPLPEGTLERLGIAMGRAQKRLRKKALRRHAALFRRSPRSFLARYRDILGRDPD